MMMASSGGSNSTSWTGKASFEERVLLEPFPENETDSGSVNQPQPGPVLPVASPGAAEDAQERANLVKEIKTLIVRQFQKESPRAVQRAFPEMEELYKNAAENILKEDLDISSETDILSLREWRDKIQNEKNLLRPLIKEYLPKRNLYI